MELQLRFLLEQRAQSLRTYERAMSTAYRLSDEGASLGAIEVRVKMAEGALKRVDACEADIAKNFPNFNGPWLAVDTYQQTPVGELDLYIYKEVDY